MSATLLGWWLKGEGSKIPTQQSQQFHLKPLPQLHPIYIKAELLALS